MQTLDAYLATADAVKLTVLADRMGVTKGRLSQLRHSKDWPPDLALKCEEALGGAISASELSSVIARARETPVQPA